MKCLGALQPPAPLLIDQRRLQRQPFFGGTALSQLVAMGAKHLLSSLELPAKVLGALPG